MTSKQIQEALCGYSKTKQGSPRGVMTFARFMGCNRGSIKSGLKPLPKQWANGNEAMLLKPYPGDILLTLSYRHRGYGAKRIAATLSDGTNYIRALTTLRLFGMDGSDYVERARAESLKMPRYGSYTDRWTSDHGEHKRAESRYNQMYAKYYRGHIQRCKWNGQYARGRSECSSGWLKDKLRNQLRKHVKGEHKKASAFDLVGCSTEYLKGHLEAQFTKRMNWGNYGRYWHIDHIIPCASFDLTKEAEQTQCFHYTNLRPMHWKANIRKSAKCPRSVQYVLPITEAIQ